MKLHVLGLLLSGVWLAGCATPSMNRRVAGIRQGERPLSLVGHGIAVGDRLPKATVVTRSNEPVSLSRYWGNVLVVSTVPSLDTPVCQAQTRRFTAEIAKFAGEVQLITISNDLPFAQDRFACEARIDSGEILSDYKGQAFGRAAGLLVKELNLLARAVLVVDVRGVVRYVQIVPDITQEPDYDTALAAVRRTLRERDEYEVRKRDPRFHD